ncbi:hypothetical protein [Shewanella surugensis]|uniref:Uncharacterized protein n=1 Tax=Shewanella surugensis TaxID=212020 RepID=A0ABT0LKV6_9GAMM|nr:hypothetical protein [Shewanella surugensis]MCL1127791.1 hypothetical protein [Shewanella surugensis]
MNLFAGKFKVLFILFIISVSPARSQGFELAGWINDTPNPYAEGFQSYLAHQSLFTEINPYWYNLGASDTGPGLYAVDGSINLREYAYDARMITKTHANGDLVLPTIADGWIPSSSNGT